jgi:hypothetical protein
MVYFAFNNENTQKVMFRRLRELYQEYKAYVRVDLVMYGVMILLILLYVIFSILT